MNNEGKIVVPFKYGFCFSFFGNDWAQVMSNTMQGFVSKEGKEIMSDSNFTVGNYIMV